MNFNKLAQRAGRVKQAQHFFGSGELPHAQTPSCRLGSLKTGDAPVRRKGNARQSFSLQPIPHRLTRLVVACESLLHAGWGPHPRLPR